MKVPRIPITSLFGAEGELLSPDAGRTWFAQYPGEAPIRIFVCMQGTVDGTAALEAFEQAKDAILHQIADNGLRLCKEQGIL